MFTSKSARAAVAHEQAEADLIKQLLGGTPFLDPKYHFAIDLLALHDRARDQPRTENPIFSFAEFKTYFDGQLSELSLSMRSSFNKAEIRNDELITSAEFLRQLPDASFTTDELDEHLSRFEAFCEAARNSEELNIDLFRSFGAAALLQPFLRWSGSVHKKGWPEACASRLEVEIERVQLSIRSHGADVPRLLEFKNILLFVYIVICTAVRVGLSAAVFSYHLFLQRAFSLARWASLGQRLRLQYGVLCLYMAQFFFPMGHPFKTQLGLSFNALTDLRSALADAAEASSELSLSIETHVFRWFVEKLEGEVFSVKGRAVGPHLVRALTNGEQGAIIELVNRFTSYRYPVTSDHMTEFLLQFGSTSRIRGAIRLLSSIRFYPLWQLAEAVEGILNSEIARHGQLVVCPLGNHTGSTSIINYLAAHSSVNNILFVEDVQRALAKTQSGSRIYFIDDCTLSGTQTLSIVGDLMGTRELKGHHTRYCPPLSDHQKGLLLQRSTIFVYCVACDYAVDRLRTEIALAGLDREKYSVISGVIEPLSAKAFGQLSPVPWESANERDDLKQFCAEVGYDLLEERASQKSWTENRRHESSLGYSDFQRLLVFPYSVPKSTLTLLWANGGSARRWVPLFPVSD